MWDTLASTIWSSWDSAVSRMSVDESVTAMMKTVTDFVRSNRCNGVTDHVRPAKIEGSPNRFEMVRRTIDGNPTKRSHGIR